jgi:hypothetical protein
VRGRRLLTSLAAVVAVALGGGAPDDDDPDSAPVPVWATRAVVTASGVEVDLAESATGTDLATYVAGRPGTRVDFHTLTGARLSVPGRGARDPGRLGASTTAWLAYAAADGSADAVLDPRGRLAFEDGT